MRIAFIALGISFIALGISFITLGISFILRELSLYYLCNVFFYFGYNFKLFVVMPFILLLVISFIIL